MFNLTSVRLAKRKNGHVCNTTCRRRTLLCMPSKKRAPGLSHRGIVKKLQKIPHGAVIGFDGSRPLFVTPQDVLKDEDKFLCFCKPCRIKSLEYGGKDTPTKEKLRKRRIKRVLNVGVSRQEKPSVTEMIRNALFL